MRGWAIGRRAVPTSTFVLLRRRPASFFCWLVGLLLLSVLQSTSFTRQMPTRPPYHRPFVAALWAVLNPPSPSRAPPSALITSSIILICSTLLIAIKEIVRKWSKALFFDLSFAFVFRQIIRASSELLFSVSIGAERGNQNVVFVSIAFFIR